MEGEQREQKRVRLASEIELSAAPVAGISEKDVGINQYLSSGLAGFRGILKNRYTDFLVNEITPDGQVLYLRDLGLLNKKEKRLEKREEERKTDSLIGDDLVPESAVNVADNKPLKFPEPNEEQESLLKNLFGLEITDKIKQLGDGTTSKVELEAVITDKEQRGKAHQLLREAYSSRIESKTTPESRFVLTLATANNSRARKSKIDKSGLGKHQNFVHFTVYKENKETVEVAHMICRFLRIPSKSLSYAGTKDRRGVTVQRFSANKVAVERLNGLNQILRGVKLGGFDYQPDKLTLGDLKGNEFFITIRKIRGKDDLPANQQEIDQSLQSLKDNGFINYYGMQRFGTFSISTHRIGIPLLKGDSGAAVDLILAEQEFTIDESKEARKIWKETKNAALALAKMPRKCVAESCILKSLSKDPNSPANAVAQIPRNLRVMYVHAYQSYVWNCVVSERFKKFGRKVVKGDLVLEKKPEKASSTVVDEDGLEEDIRISEYARARPVTEEEIKFLTIFDIVLPTPGYDVVYPENELLDVYKSVMAQDGLDPLNMRRNVKDFSLSGSYRSIAVKPGNVRWWFKRYNDETEQLVKTDLDILNQNGVVGERLANDNAEEKGENLALILNLTLQSSQYATMALREIMKVDTARRGEGFF